jgi:hypothetical protein
MEFVTRGAVYADSDSDSDSDFDFELNDVKKKSKKPKKSKIKKPKIKKPKIKKGGIIEGEETLFIDTEDLDKFINFKVIDSKTKDELIHNLSMAIYCMMKQRIIYSNIDFKLKINYSSFLTRTIISNYIEDANTKRFRSNLQSKFESHIRLLYGIYGMRYCINSTWGPDMRPICDLLFINIQRSPNTNIENFTEEFNIISTLTHKCCGCRNADKPYHINCHELRAFEIFNSSEKMQNEFEMAISDFTTIPIKIDVIRRSPPFCDNCKAISIRFIRY